MLICMQIQLVQFTNNEQYFDAQSTSQCYELCDMTKISTHVRQWSSAALSAAAKLASDMALVTS